MAMTLLRPRVAEIQPRGILLDETEAGYSRVLPIGSNAAFVPLVASTYNTSLQGSATVSQQFAAEGNPFGTLDGLLTTVPAGSIASPQSAAIYFQFMGRQLWLAWDRYRGSNPNPLTGWVDGKFFALDNTIKDVASAALGTSSAGSMYRNVVQVPVVLKDDGPHQCKIYCSMDLANAVQRQYLIYGYGVERRFANEASPPSSISRYLALTTSFQSIGAQGAYGFGIRGLQFANPNLGAANITLERDGVVLPAIALANNAHGTYDFLDYIKVNRSSSLGTGVIRVKSDVAGVQMWIIQRTM
jgi:hypothetical protein